MQNLLSNSRYLGEKSAEITKSFSGSLKGLLTVSIFLVEVVFALQSTDAQLDSDEVDLLFNKGQYTSWT